MSEALAVLPDDTFTREQAETCGDIVHQRGDREQSGFAFSSGCA